MKRIVSLILIAVLCFSLVPAASAGAPLSVTLVDDGTVTASNVRCNMAGIGLCAKREGVEITLNEVRIGSYTNTGKEYFAGFDARPGQTVTTVSLDVTVLLAFGEKFDPDVAALTADSGESVNICYHSTTPWSHGWKSNAPQTGKLFFILHATPVDELRTFTVTFDEGAPDGALRGDPIEFAFTLADQ